MILEYEVDSGNLYDVNGVLIVSWQGLQSFADGKAGVPVADLVKLKDAGFTAEEIVDLKRKEVIR